MSEDLFSQANAPSTTPKKFSWKRSFILRLGLPSTLIRHENGKTEFFKPEEFEKASFEFALVSKTKGFF